MALKDKRPLIKWHNQLVMIDRWPSLTIEYLDQLLIDDPEKYFFMVATNQALNEKEEKLYNKLKK